MIKKNITTKKDHFATTKTTPNYKDVLLLRRFLTDKFKIQPTTRTGLSSKNQRKLATEIKKLDIWVYFHIQIYTPNYNSFC